MKKTKVVKAVAPVAKETTVTTPTIDVKVSRIHKITGTGDTGTLAFVDVNIAGLVGSVGWRVVNNPKGIFVSPPREKGKDGKYRETTYGLTSQVRDSIKAAIMNAYNAKAVLVEPILL